MPTDVEKKRSRSGWATASMLCFAAGVAISTWASPESSNKTSPYLALANLAMTFASLIFIMGAVLGIIAMIKLQDFLYRFICMAIAFTNLFFLLYFNRSQPSTRSPVSSVKADMRTLATAIESFQIDYSEPPPWATGEQGANRELGPESPAWRVPTFRVWATPEEVGTFPILTSPVSFIQELPDDCFTPRMSPDDRRRAAIGYYADGKNYLLFSAGPDGDYDLDPIAAFAETGLTSGSELFVLFAYDPTNGAESSGDIIDTSF